MSTSIPRRPVGAAATERASAGSIASASSTYSSSPGFSRSMSDSSNKTKDSLSGIDSEADASPPLPQKDSQRQPQTTKSTLGSPASSFQTSPLRPEIWRRRPVKSDRSIVFPELKLSNSNGSTAGPPPERELPALPSHSQLPRSQAQKLLPARPAPPQPDLGGMGQKFSKLKDKARRGSRASEDVQPQSHYSPFQRKRLPTPDYLKSDKLQKTIIPQVLSPISPETPPVDDAPPAVPPRAESRSTSSLTIVPDTVLANRTNRPDLLSSHSRDTSETLTVTSELQVVRSPQPQKAYAAKILTPSHSPPPSEQIRSLDSIPPVTTPASKLNINFPKPSTPSTPGAILQGPQLGIVHLECYHNHNQMRHSKNTLCPVACMVCRKNEIGPLWRCAWCCLSACGACMQVLTSIPGRDLRVCLERVEKKGEKRQKSISSGTWR
ncbi:hypothetical protein D0Z07_6271 [Hyphodiscus hymeniophilus]|uniref:Uncharacterized protein n=1 Tax=Hyphodiscus hymeniophilus TaxID=353542 RepID=A0A9P6VF49_9HELO|nr:hypothetical protein D0Z07_6271 [Hyphodiscus hymeniophilus]